VLYYMRGSMCVACLRVGKWVRAVRGALRGVTEGKVQSEVPVAAPRFQCTLSWIVCVHGAGRSSSSAWVQVPGRAAAGCNAVADVCSLDPASEAAASAC
jgi:hypothetical protein